MRTDKELLELVLDNFDVKMREWGCYGICSIIDNMAFGSFISKKENERLDDIIYQNPTEYGKKHLHYFPILEVEPRIEYLKQLIEKYS